jgi:hypothetical protein
MAEIAGRNARELRLGADVTLEQFAAAARHYGLKWTSGRVGDFEAGRTAPTLPTLIVVAAALANLTGSDVAVEDLFEGEGRVTLTDRLSLDLRAVRSAFTKGAVVAPLDMTDARDAVKRAIPEWEERRKSWPEALLDVPPARIGHVYLAMSDSDKRMCKTIGVDYDLGAAAMAELWDKPFTARRDELAGPDANPQERGQVSRQLKAALVSILQGEEQRRTR